MMNRAIVLSALLVILAAPLALVHPQPAAAAGTITVITVERGSGKPAPYAKYCVSDLREDGGLNGGVGCATDTDGDGTTHVQVAPCDPCHVAQALPEQPDGQPTDYLLEEPQITSLGGTLTFRNFLKPYFVVTLRDAQTGNLVKGGCILMSRPNVGGSGFGACDGNPNGGNADRDGRKNGKIRTARLPTPDGRPATLTYKVENTTPWYTARSVKESAEPATTGEFETVTLKLRRSS